jgi:hypothetical protein
VYRARTEPIERGIPAGDIDAIDDRDSGTMFIHRSRRQLVGGSADQGACRQAPHPALTEFNAWVASTRTASRCR